MLVPSVRAFARFLSLCSGTSLSLTYGSPACYFLFEAYSSMSPRSQLLGSLQGFAASLLLVPVLEPDDLGGGAARRLQGMKPLLSWEGGGWPALC